MTESKIPIPTCRPQGAALRKVRSLKHTEIRPSDDISYVIKNKLEGRRINLGNMS